MIIPGIVSISSVLLYTYLPDLLSTIIKSQLILKDGDDSLLFQNWVKTPVPVDYSFYFFQINNPNEVLRGIKPRVTQVGPFCFKQYRTKKVVGWSENGETVKYLEYKNNIFSPEVEGCKSTLDEKITVINPPIAALGATIADIVREKVPLTAVTSPIIMSSISAFMAAHQQNMFMKRSVKDILLGFRINLLDTITTLIRPLEMLGYRKEDLLPGGGIPNNTFGLLYGKNNTPEGPFEVYTGKNSRYRFVHLAKFKNKPTLSFWKSQYCNQLSGSDGTMFGAGVKRSDKLWVFSSDICRSIYLTYMRDGEFKGIPTYVFGLNDKLFGNFQTEPKNECFCVHPESLKHRCSINGILDISACQGGAPLIVSKPHYLSTDPDLSQKVEGFEPNKNDHDTIIEVEPLTGIPINALKKLQFSLRVENVPFLRGFNNMKNVTYIPFAMAIEKGSLPDDMIDMLRGFVFNPLKFIYWGLLGAAGVAALFAGRSGVKKLKTITRKHKPVQQLRKSAKNLYKKHTNVVDSEISSTSSKNSMSELVPKTNEDFRNETNVKFQSRNESQANRLYRLSANRLQTIYMNGQSVSFPQILPIFMPFPYLLNQDSSNPNRNDDKNKSNNTPMITKLNSRPIDNEFTMPQTENFASNELTKKNPDKNLNLIFNSISKGNRSNVEKIATGLKKSYEYTQNNSSYKNFINQSNIDSNMTPYKSNIESILKSYNESTRQTPAEYRIEEIVDANQNEKSRQNSIASENYENMKDLQYSKIDDQFYYNNRNEHEISTDKMDDMRDSQMNDKYDETNLIETNELPESISIDRETKKDHNEKRRTSIDELSVVHDDSKKIKKLGYDYNFYD